LAGLLSVAAPAGAHPLDSLSAAEIRAVVGALKAAGVAIEASRFPLIKLAPPAKTQVWDWSPGKPAPRRAFVVIRSGADIREAEVDLSAGRIVSVRRRPGAQSNIVAEEWSRATELVKADPRWNAALRKRGIADARAIFCDALSPGHFRKPERRRLLKVPCYDARGTSNVYGRPIEGLMATVDLDADKVIAVTDSGLVPVSRADPSLEQEKQGPLQPRMQSIGATVAAGRNFTVDRSIIRWAAWSFHLSFDQRVGPIVSTVRYRDGERDRPVLYQGHISEMFVPYMDPDPNWSFRSYMDVGEYGFGSLASKLVEGVDCPAGAMMLSATLPDDRGEPHEQPGIMCAFERNTTTPLWRRYEIVTGSHEARSDIEFVLRTIPVVGNYDYIVDWVFNLKGEIRIDVAATGIAAAKGVAAANADEHKDADLGALVGPNLSAPNHDHFLSFRLDLDVDGPVNSFVRERLEVRSLPAANARRSIWRRAAQRPATELGIAPGHAPELWRIENPSAKTALGYAPAFELAGHGAVSLLDPQDSPQRRAAFSARPLWVTRHRSSELYAAGDYPNQHPGGDGLPRYVSGESVQGQDLVAWYTMGFHHVTRPEDWPVLPTVRHSLTLRPHAFFDRNPAISVPRDVQPARPQAGP
jgi:primary-amine oxidase